MRGCVTGLVALALVVTASAALADGAPIMRREHWRYLSEQRQAAVVSVKADRTATVDLFISLLAKPGAPKEMHFLLPLQTLPKEFHAREVGSEQFRREKLMGLEDVIHAAREREVEAKERPARARWAGAVLAGPVALAGMLARREGGYLNASAMGAARSQGSAGGAGPAPALSVETKHTAADIYPSLKPEEVAALAQAPDLPEEVRDTLARYAGRPFALIRLEFLPSREGEGGARVRYRDVPGVQFTFAQEMRPAPSKERVAYDFPLGTGTAWAEPVADTVVYVTASEDLNVKVDFPGPTADEAYAYGREPTRSAAAKGKQVYVYSEVAGNAQRDIPITLLARGTSLAVAERKASERVSLAITIGLPLLGVGVWLISFHLIIARGRKLTRGAWLRSAGGSWVAAQVIGAVVLLVALYLSPSGGLSRHAWGQSWIWYLFDSDGSGRTTSGALLLAFAAVWALTVWLVTRKTRDDVALLGLTALAAVVSGIAYVAFSALLMGA